jgi:hypothetical protein
MGASMESAWKGFSNISFVAIISFNPYIQFGRGEYQWLRSQ